MLFYVEMYAVLRNSNRHTERSIKMSFVIKFYSKVNKVKKITNLSPSLVIKLL